MLKKVVLVAGIAAALGFAVSPATANPTACVDIYVDANGTVVEQSACVPPAE